MTAHQAYDAFFLPPEVDPDEAIRIGVDWLLAQPGDPLILLHAKKMIDNNRLLGNAARRHRIQVEAPTSAWKSRWGGGSILAPWTSDKVLRAVDDDLAAKADAVCVIGWRPGDPNHLAWVTVRRATDLLSGDSLGKSREELVSDPVVRIAIDEAERFVNHNNALVQAEDKAYCVRTLQELIRGGHRFEIAELTAYAMATGWTGDEIVRIREYGERILSGRGFRLQTSVGPKPGSCRHWEALAAEQVAEQQ
jgi:hypothetical protein